MSKYFSDNKQIPTSLQKDAVYLEKTLDWEDDGADGLWHFYLKGTFSLLHCYKIETGCHLAKYTDNKNIK